jgi:hypothetical protein
MGLAYRHTLSDTHTPDKCDATDLNSRDRFPGSARREAALISSCITYISHTKS